MDMLKRKAMKEIRHWFEQEKHKALCILGARQTGKTTLVREFARKMDLTLVELNFLSDPSAALIFQETPDPAQILLQLSYRNPEVDLDSEKTLVLFDEIQECPEARTAVKFLVESSKCRFVETGSLLGGRLKDIRSVPVGYELLMNLYPLDFEEFMWSTRINPQIIETLKNCALQSVPVPEYLHGKMLELFRTYMAVGGMPAVVQRFADTGNPGEVQTLLDSLWVLYQQDIVKYADIRDRPWILTIFDNIPSELMKPNSRFMLNSVRSKGRYTALEPSFAWLTEAGIALPCINVTEPVFPLQLREKRSIFKFFLLDTGLLCSRYKGVSLEIIQNSHRTNWGGFLENMAAQILCASGYSLFYYNSRKHGEIDFVLEEGSRISLIEMKSGRGYRNHAALNNVMEVPSWNFHRRLVFCEANVFTEDGIGYYAWHLMPFVVSGNVTPKEIPFSFESLQIPE